MNVCTLHYRTIVRCHLLTMVYACGIISFYVLKNVPRVCTPSVIWTQPWLFAAVVSNTLWNHYLNNVCHRSKLFNLTFTVPHNAELFGRHWTNGLRVNQSVWPPALAVPQIPAVRPPRHQRGLFLQPQHSQCLLPSCPGETSPAKSSSACLWEVDNTCFCPSVPRPFLFFSFFPLKECCPCTKSLVFLHIRQEQILCLSTFVSALVSFCIHPVGDQLSRAALPLHRPPWHRAASRPEAVTPQNCQFVCQSSRNLSAATTGVEERG